MSKFSAHDREEIAAGDYRYYGVDRASGPDRTVYVCREHINTPHPACPACAEATRLAPTVPAESK